MASYSEIKQRIKQHGVSDTQNSKDRYQRIKHHYINGGYSLDSLGVDEEYIDSFIKDANSFFDSAQKDYEGIGWSNASSTYDTKYSTYNDLYKRGENIRVWLNGNKRSLDEDTYKSLSDSLSSISSSSKSVIDGFEEYKKYYSQWETEEDYNNAIKAQEDYEALLNYNLDVAKKVILAPLEGDRAGVEATLHAIRQLESENTILEMRSTSENLKKLKENEAKIEAWYKSLDEALLKYGFDIPQKEYTRKAMYEAVLLDEIDARISKEKQYYTLAERTQKAVKMKDDALKATDFAQHSIVNKDVPYDGTHKYINDIDGFRQKEWENYNGPKGFVYTDTGAAMKIPEPKHLTSNYDKMTDEEIGIYNYYYNTAGKAKAEEYLDTIQETLNQRSGAELFEGVEGNVFLEYVFGAAAGVDQFTSGIKNLFSNEDYIPMSEMEFASSMIREDLEDVGFELPEWMGGASIGQVGYDLTTTTANMLPSILVSYVPVVGQVAGPALMGASAAGNAKTEMLRLGYSKEQANSYGLLVGASEGALQYALGGISKLGGKLSGNVVSKFVSKFDNALARTAIKIGGNMVSEGLEEALQSIIEPAFKSFVTGESYEVDWGEVLYSGILGAVTAGVLEGPSTIAGEISTYKAGKNIQGNADALARLTNLGSTMSVDSVAYKLAGKIDANTGAYTIGRLLNEVGASLSDANISDVVKSLEQKGMTTEDAQTIAKWLNKAVEGEYFSNKQIAALESNDVLAQTLVDVLISPNSTAQQRINSYNELAGLAQTKASASNASPTQAEATTATENTPAKENAAEGNFEASESISESIETDSKVDVSENISESGETDNTVTLADVSKKYGAQAQAMVHTYTEGQDVAKYDKAYKAAYDMGMSGVSLDYAKNSESTSYLTETQRELAHEAGRAAADTTAKEQDAKNKQSINGKTGRKKGTVKGEGVTISDLKKTFNDTQNKAYKILSTYAEATGIDIVLYKSETNADGDFEGSQGKFKWSEDKIYIDINAGLKNIKDVNDLAKYAMIRTFSHEFTHFIEKWNPIWYNEFRKVVFDTLTQRGENVHDLIETKMSMNEGMTYDKASREVVAEAMTDILPDANFVETLATKHKNIFDKLLDKLKEFLADLKAYFKTIGHNPSREANALKDQVEDAVHYVDNIVKLFDKVALEAVENYQATVATEKFTEKSTKTEKSLFEKYNDIKQKYPDNIVLYRVGDFFEVIGEDAKAVAKWTNLTLTGRNDPNAGRVPMVGFPFHTLEKFVEKIRKHQSVTFVQEENGAVKEYPMAPLEAPKKNATISTEESKAQSKPDPYGLTDDEIGSIVKYKSGESYTLNAKLREDVELDEYDQEIVNNLDKALDKLPAYKGVVYRNIQFDGFGDKAARDAYIAMHAVGEMISYDAYTSTSTATDGYVLDGDFVVHHVIQSENGRNMAGYGSNAESEVLFARTIDFITNRIEYDSNGTPTIYLTEVAHEQRETGPQSVHGRGIQGNNQRDTSRESRQYEATNDAEENKVQRLHSQNTRDSEMQPAISERNTVNGNTQQGDLQGVQAEVKAPDTAEETQENPFDKRTLSLLNKAKKVGAIDFKGQMFVTDGIIMFPTTKAGLSYAYTELNAITMPPDIVHKIISAEYKPIIQAPIEGTVRADKIYAFNIDGKIKYFAKKLFPHIDGGDLYYGEFTKEAGIIKSVNEDGSVKGYLLGMKIPNGTTLSDEKPSKLKSFSKKKQSPTNTKEVNQNVETENADNERPILEPDTDGQRASRLLDESQTADVRGASSERNAVEDTRQRESETSRNGDRTDADARDSRSEGSGEVGDLRRDELTEQETQAKAEELAETVEREIEQKSTDKPKGNNFVIGDSLNLPDGEKARYRANVDAIRLIKLLETEGRYATASEQEILSKYVGWGGLDKAFGEYRYNRDTRRSEMAAKDGWEKEFAELKSLVDEGIITEQEYKDMSASTKNAHYTSIEVIKAMYDGLAGLGFNGGRMLEPSSGVGNFVGAMPTDMSAKVNSWTMVELDRITGLIAKYLYPNSDVRIQGFENANIPDNYMDVAIGNVPFGNFGVVDRTYPKRITKAIHNYFFAKSIDKVRPGGIVMFITSSFTMNAKDTTVRQYIMERADLLGAIRLPNTAFKGNAGTEVVTDILILKKREGGTEYAGEDFLEADYDTDYGTYTSNYFKNHPEMVLGKPVTKRGMYGAHTLTFEPFTDRGTIDDQIREAFKNIKGKMDYPSKLSPEKTNFAVEKATKKSKSGGFVVHSDGSISRNENGQLVKYDTDEKTAKRIAGMLGIRDAYKTLANYLQQGVETKYIKQARTALNTAYDKFVKEYGYINSPANRKAIDSDPDSYSILSLENYDVQKKIAKKADIFTKDTISANKTITHVDSIEEGVIASINLTGGVDVSLIAKLTDKTADDITREIIDSRLAFKTRDNGLVARETYLSGNVRAKLREAEALAPYDQDFNNNIEELRKVIPTDIPYNEIYITPGATFIPNEIYADFIAHMLGGRNNPNSYSGADVEVGRTASGEFKIIVNNKRLKNSYYNTQTWGTARKSFLELIDAMMGSRTVKVNDVFENADGKKVSVVNEAETEAANEKVKAIQKEFEDWIWKDEDRRTALARLYNETFNAIVNPKYDGSHLSVNGINSDYSLREHQANAVHRIISSGGNTLLAHRVGAGKTLEMAAAAMKMRELGVIKKPVFVVPKSVVAQWGVEFHSYFPAARLLVADDKSFTPANRKIFTNKIANGDYDAVIVSYEQFEKIPMSAEYQQRFYEEQIDEIIAAIAEEKAESRDGKGLTVKEMEKKKAQLEKKLKELTSKPKDENNVDFEMLGIDSLFVDEAHNFKNLEYVSKMSNVAGLGSAKGSQRAFDLYTKIRYLQGLNGGRGVVFATATPVMNSMVELYIMQRYLQPDILNQLGLKSFDAWAKQFGEVVNKWEINPSGTGMRQKQVFANFRNLNELQLLFRSFADVLTEVPGLKIPKMKGGAVKIVECEPGEFQKNYMQELQKRAENVKNVDPSEDNMLKITSDGRKVSYTQRMIDPTLPYEPDSKIFKAAENVLKEYQDSADIKGTQIVFLDMATPKGTDKSKTETNTDNSVDDTYDEESARLYDDMRDYLVKKGIPKREIAFIHEADSDAKRKQLFEDVNNGKVRVLIGSTGKMGVGMNAQKRVVAIHHLDAPWRPGDVEQRDGRAFRQKNINEEVSKYVYVTKGSFDSRLWDILDRKQHFINQIMNGEDVGRTAEDTGEVTLSAAEVKALASGNPLIEEQTKLTDEIKKLENLQKAYNSSIRLAKTKLSDDEVKITNYTNRIARIREDIVTRVDTYSEGKFSMTVGKQVFTDKKDAGAALATAIVAKANADSYVTIGKFAGFELRAIKNGSEYNGLIHGKESYKFNTYLNNTTRMVNHIGEIIAGFENIIKNTEQMISETTADRNAQNNILAKPFEKQDELNKKRARFNEVMELLAPKTEEQLSKTDDDTVQEQSREYLDEQHQQRTYTLTDREVLEMAANEIKVSDLTQAENDALTIFQDRLSKLKDLQNERAEQGRLYKEQQFGEKVDRAKAAETLNRMQILDSQIKKATTDILTVEEKEVLKRVLQKARKVVEVQERQHGQEILNRWRDRRNNAADIKKYRDRLRGDVDELSNWILHPNNKDIVKHVPDVLKNSVIPFLSSINFMSKRALKGGAATKADNAFMTQLEKLNAALKSNIEINGLYSGYNDLPPNFMENLQNFINSTNALVKKQSGELVINLMTSAELKELSRVVRTLKKYIMQVNRFHYNAMYEHVYEAGENSIEHLKDLGNAGNTGAISNFLLWQQIRPAYAFERFGNGGIAIYDGLRRGQAKLAFNTKEIQSFTEKAYTEKEVKAWENELKSFSLGKDLVKMPVSYIMAFYELSKDPEALEHINGEGIRVATYTHKGKKISDTGHVLTVGEFNQIIGSLTDRQREVADNLQKYMAEQGGKWGNYVSVARFGEELFTNKKYFPINSDGRHLQANADEHPSAAALYALLNMSFTKSRKEGANNRIVIYSIFDVFANHMASMAQYNAMALPILDALKWFNYQQVFIDDDGTKHIGDSVRERMDRAYGVPEETRPGKGKSGYAQDFVMNIIKAFNGTEAQGTPYDSLGLKSLHRYNVAQVAYNLRVVVQQPLAITRAGLLLNYGSILKGMKLKPSSIKKNIEEMQKYSGIAAWKSLGFYDVNVSRGLTHIIKHDSTFMDKVGDVGMWGAEKADLLTWAAIWSASKEEVTKKQHLTPSSEGFYDEVTKLFEDIIYKTQVVDSVLTKNEFMRDKGAFARLVGSFMSEPTTNASMLIDAYDKYALDIQRGMTRQQAWKKNKRIIGRTLYVYGVGAILLAAVQAAADALRDDDEYEEWYEKWLEAFGGNFVDELMPFNKLPILSDFYDLAKEIASIFGADTYGNPPQSVFMQWYDSLIKGTEIIYDKISNEDTNYTWYGGIYKLLQAASGITGLPMASATREIITAWNNTVGAMAPSLKITTYEPSELSEIRYAYEDGYLTAEEATEQLLEKGLVDSEDEAYFTIQSWEAGENYSRYDKVYDAVRNGASIDEAMDELTSHGYSEEDILIQVKSEIGKWYRGGEISKQQAINMLTKYFDMSSNEINATVSYWEYKKDNPDADVNVGLFETYYSDVAHSGISINDYITYRNKVKDITGEDKKARRMKVINSLPITNAQKDALYYAEGWAESKLYEAPWH